MRFSDETRAHMTVDAVVNSLCRLFSCSPPVRVACQGAIESMALDTTKKDGKPIVPDAIRQVFKVIAQAMLDDMASDAQKALLGSMGSQTPPAGTLPN